MAALLTILVCLVVILLITMIYLYKAFPSKKTVLSIKESLELVDLPIITVDIDGKKFNLMVDTGSNLSYINESSLEGIEYLASETKKTVVTAQGELKCSCCELDIEYKECSFGEVFYLADLTESFDKVKEETGVTIHGILGNSFLIKYKYVLDFAKFIMFSKK